MCFQKDGMTLGCLVVALVVAHYRRTTQVPEIAIYLRTYLHASFQRTVDFACIRKIPRFCFAYGTEGNSTQVALVRTNMKSTHK